MIKKITRSASLLLPVLLLALPVAAQAKQRDPERIYDCENARSLPAEANEESRRIVCEIPAKYREDVAMAQFVGAHIRLHDMAAWLTTDALVRKKAFEGISGQGRGWLTLQQDKDIDVRYFMEREGRTEAIAAATLDVDKVKAVRVRKLAPAEPMSLRESRLMKAKLLALATEGLTVCTNHAPNTVVFESDEFGRKEILVFVMSAWDDHAAPLGGYHMFRVSEDGEAVITHFAQTNTCLTADLRVPGMDSLMLSHLTSAAPTVFHVFMSLQYRKPLMVVTTQNGLLWKVEQGRIFLLNDGKPVKSKELSNETPDGANGTDQ